MVIRHARDHAISIASLFRFISLRFTPHSPFQNVFVFFFTVIRRVQGARGVRKDSDDSEMNYIFEIEMDAYRQEASASANPFDNSDLEEGLF